MSTSSRLNLWGWDGLFRLWGEAFPAFGKSGSRFQVAVSKRAHGFAGDCLSSLSNSFITLCSEEIPGEFLALEQTQSGYETLSKIPV